MNDNLKKSINDARDVTQRLAGVVKHLKKHPSLAPSLMVRTDEDPGEAIANLTLAYRHLEDARMRLGKAIQAMEGGVSIFDKSGGVEKINPGT